MNTDESNAPSVIIVVVVWAGWEREAIDIANAAEESGYQAFFLGKKSEAFTSFKTSSGYIETEESDFWGAKFFAAIKVLEPHVTPLFVHADCRCNDWSALFTRACDVLEADKRIGIYSPFVMGTPWSAKRVSRKDVHLTLEHLLPVVLSDALVFALRPCVARRMRRLNYSANNLGWGVDWFYHAVCHDLNLISVVDQSQRVLHRAGSGYDKQRATVQMKGFLAQMTDDEARRFRWAHSIIAANEELIRERSSPA